MAQGALVPPRRLLRLGPDHTRRGLALGRDQPKKRRRDKQPHQDRFRIDDRVVSQAEIWAEDPRPSDHVDDQGRLLFMDSPALGLSQVATGIARTPA
jgi:hypothetical protein